MRIRRLVAALCLALAVLVSGCGKPARTAKVATPAPPTKYDVKVMGADICAGDVGKVTDSWVGTDGSPIVLLEERHDSRAVQIEEAIALVRLHDKYRLRDIGLEGYTREEPKIDSAWIASASRGLDTTARASVAARFLREGETSSVEFMKLVYDDVTVHPVEAKAEYSVGSAMTVGSAPLAYLFQIAQKSITEEDVPRLTSLVDEVKSAKGAEKEEKQKELLRYVMSLDSWCKERADLLLSEDRGKVMSDQEELDLLRSIQQRAEEAGISMPEDQKKGMADCMHFFEARARASSRMAAELTEITARTSTASAATTIGAAHTKTMCSAIRDAGRPYIAIRPSSFKAPGDVSNESMRRKYERLPVFGKGLGMQVRSAVTAPRALKPPVVLTEDWFQALDECSLFTDRIVRDVLGPPSPPSGGNPPFGFADDDFIGKWVRIDPKRIELIGTKSEPGQYAVLFPMRVNHRAPGGGTVFWVKAGLSRQQIRSVEREGVEAILKQALADVKSERKSLDQSEDSLGRIRISLNSMAGFARTYEAARAMQVSDI